MCVEILIHSLAHTRHTQMKYLQWIESCAKFDRRRRGRCCCVFRKRESVRPVIALCSSSSSQCRFVFLLPVNFIIMCFVADPPLGTHTWEIDGIYSGPSGTSQKGQLNFVFAQLNVANSVCSHFHTTLRIHFRLQKNHFHSRRFGDSGDQNLNWIFRILVASLASVCGRSANCEHIKSNG